MNGRALWLAIVAALAALVCRREPPPACFSLAREVGEANAEFDRVQFRSFRKDGRLTAQVSMDGAETRFALVPPVPSSLTYRLAIPRQPRLVLSYGVATLEEDALPAPIDFRIRVDGSVAFEGTVRRRFANRWFAPEVDLGSWAGKRVALTLETRYRETEFTPAEAALAASGQGVLAAWADPVLIDRSLSGSRPDLVLISVDCLRSDHVSAYGYSRETTPNLDALAKDGVLFEDAVSVSSWTLPTHMSMLTGLLPTEHGLRQDQKRFPSVPYLPDLLGRNGYETVGIVSSLLLTPVFGFDEGFDRYHALPDVPASKLVDTAILEMSKNDGRSRFLFLHLFDAHWPYEPAADVLARFGGRPKDISDLLKKVIDRRPPSGPDEIEELKSLYDAEIFQVDRELGRLFQAMKDSGRYEDALIIATADHGEAFWEHGFWQHSEVIYSEVTHVPLVVKWPKKARRGRESRLVDQLHIFPTLLDAAGLPTPHERKGLASPEETRALTEITWEGNESKGPAMKVAVRKGPLKYVATFEGDVSDPEFVSRLVREELYDRSRDPGEREDLFGKGDVEAFRSDVRRFLEDVRSRRSSDSARAIVLDEKMRDRLRALGYLDP
jgi:arylsulfatase A-like enzyme